MQDKLLNISELLIYIYNKLNRITKFYLQSWKYVYKLTKSHYNSSMYPNEYTQPDS